MAEPIIVPGIKKLSKKQKITLLKQGAYGCIYRPGMSCDGKIESGKFISKIQLKDGNSDNEVSIGKKVMKIDKNYAEYYAPIVESCEVSLGTIDNDELQKCNIIKKSTDEKKILQSTYISNKIRYVGKKTLHEALFYFIENIPKLFLVKFIESFKYLLKSVSYLNAAGIIHFDLKESNIIYSRKPIIIDFGISFDKNQLNGDNLKQVFFTYGPDYPPWCIDIAFVTYIGKLPGNFEMQIVTEEQYVQIIEDFVTKNDIMKSIGDNESRQFKERMTAYMASKYKGKTWGVLIQDLLENVGFWDTYSIAVVYYFLIEDLRITLTDIPFILDFEALLRKTILSLPNERIDSNQLFKEATIIFTSIKNKSHLLETMVKKSGVSGNIEQQRQSLLETKLKGIEMEHNIMTELQKPLGVK